MAEDFTPAAGGAARGSVGIAGQQSDPNNTATGSGPALRPYQQTAIARIEADPHRRRILVTAPTGSGKTVLAAELIRRARDRGERCLFVDHRREITTQTCRKLWDLGLDHGIVQAGFPPRPGEAIQVASVQTLHARTINSRSIDLSPADLVIIDEAHHARARTYQRIVAAYPNARIVGLTATPCRGDGRGLGNTFENLIEVATVADLIRDGYLVPTKVFAPTRPDLTGVHVKRGDYVESELAARMNTATLVGDIVEHWHKLAECRPTVIFTVSVAHSLHVRDELRRSGVLAEHIDGSTPIGERDATLAKLAAGSIEIVANCQVLTEGWDCPEVSCIVLARPTKSLGLYRQMVGRVLRPAIRKSDALVLDHAGAVFQHGFVEDPIEWELREDKRAENKAHAARGQYRAPALTTCPECSAVRFEGQPCPVCHWRPVAKAKPIEFADGELGRVARDRRVTVPTSSANDQRNFYAQLLWIANERGYAAGWAAHKFKEKFGDWPAAWMRHSGAIPPTDPVRAWVRSRQIAFARAMDKARASA